MESESMLSDTDNERVRVIKSLQNHANKLIYSKESSEIHGLPLLQKMKSCSSNAYSSQISNKKSRSVNFRDSPQVKTNESPVRSTEEKIEAQILPQDDNWPDTTTFTAATSDLSIQKDLWDFPKDIQNRLRRFCNLGYIFTVLVCTVSFLSSVIFIVLPYFNIKNWTMKKFGPECESVLISIVFKVIILVLGSWLLFFQKRPPHFPGIDIFRIFVLILLVVIAFTYWAFYCFRIIEAREQDYYKIILFTSSYIDVLLFVHYFSFVILKLRQIQPQFAIKIVRSPDGETRHYNVGYMSIQSASNYVLEKYSTDFSIYNPWLESARRRRVAKAHSAVTPTYKVYNLECLSGTELYPFSSAAIPNTKLHSDRFYEELEYQRRLQKRKARLITATEEAFSHVKRFQESRNSDIALDPNEAAQAVFVSISRSLQKYLRISRQQPFFTRQSIIDHLAVCLSYDISPKAFLKRYLSADPALFIPKECSMNQDWLLLCDCNLYNPIFDELMFVMRRHDVSLLCHFKKLPQFNIIEEMFDSNRNKFVFKLSSETSV